MKEKKPKVEEIQNKIHKKTYICPRKLTEQKKMTQIYFILFFVCAKNRPAIGIHNE